MGSLKLKSFGLVLALVLLVCHGYASTPEYGIYTFLVAGSIDRDGLTPPASWVNHWNGELLPMALGCEAGYAGVGIEISFDKGYYAGKGYRAIVGFRTEPYGIIDFGPRNARNVLALWNYNPWHNTGLFANFVLWGHEPKSMFERQK